MLEKMLDTKGLTERFPGTRPNYWAKLRCRGDGPEFLKINRKIYYEESTVAAWLQTKRRISTSDDGGGEFQGPTGKSRVRSAARAAAAGAEALLAELE